MNLPFYGKEQLFTLTVNDLSPDHPQAYAGHPMATLELLDGLQADDTLFWHIARLASIVHPTLQVDESRKRYTFLVNSYMRTSTEYAPKHFAADIKQRVEWLKERIEWRRVGKDPFLLQGLCVTFKGYANIEKAEAHLYEALRLANVVTFPTRPSRLSEEDHTFIINTSMRPAITSFFS